MFIKRLSSALAAIALLCTALIAPQVEAQVTYTSRPGFTVNSASQVLTGLYTFSSLPLANAYPGYEAYTTDSGSVYSNGSVWTPLGVYPEYNVAQWSVPVILGPSAFFANNGVMVIGQAPASAATLSVSATSGSVTATFSAATLLGTASDIGRVITILDTTYKYCTITANTSTTVATCTVSGATLSGTGPFANANVWISGTVSGVASYSAPLPAVYPNAYFAIPVNAITASTAAGIYYGQCVSTTVCTLYNNLLASGQPTMITTPTPFVTTGNGAVAQSTSAVTLVSVPIVAGTIGANGVLSVSTYGLRVNDANATTETYLLGGSTAGVVNTASVIWYPMERQIRNSASVSTQVVFPAATSSANDQASVAAAPSYLAINTAAATTFGVQGTLATATDYLVLLGGLVQIEYAP